MVLAAHMPTVRHLELRGAAAPRTPMTKHQGDAWKDEQGAALGIPEDPKAQTLGKSNGHSANVVKTLWQKKVNAASPTPCIKPIM